MYFFLFDFVCFQFPWDDSTLEGAMAGKILIVITFIFIGACSCEMTPDM